MRSVDFQTVHTQTPAVERSYQTRPGQVEQEQRLAANVQQAAAEQKAKETQAAAESKEAKIQLDKDREQKQRQQGKKKKKGQQVEDENSSESTIRKIDITV